MSSYLRGPKNDCDTWVAARLRRPALSLDATFCLPMYRKTPQCVEIRLNPKSCAFKCVHDDTGLPFSDANVPSESSVYQHCDHARGVDLLGCCLPDDEIDQDGVKPDLDEDHLHGGGDGRGYFHGDDDGVGHGGGHGGGHRDGSTNLQDISSREACKLMVSNATTLAQGAVPLPTSPPVPSFVSSLRQSPTLRSYARFSWSSLAAGVLCRRCGRRYLHCGSVRTQQQPSPIERLVRVCAGLVDC